MNGGAANPVGESSAMVEQLLHWIELVSLGIELLAISIIVLAIVYGTLRYVYETLAPGEFSERYDEYKRRLGQSLLLGLEILVAADIIRTVALDATIQSVLVLGLLVLIRTFLSWSVIVEIEGRWPWQARRGSGEGVES